MKTLVAGVGNIFLSDDAFGVEVMKQLSSEQFPAGVQLFDAGIGGIHLAHELLNDYDVLVMIDCMPSGETPGTVSVFEIEPEEDGSWSQLESGAAALGNGHGFEPHVALNMVKLLGGEVHRVYVVGCEPETVVPGMDLSDCVAGALNAAADEVRALVRRLHEKAEATYEQA